MKHLHEVEEALKSKHDTREAYFGKSPVPLDIKFEIVDVHIVVDDNKRKRAHVRVKISFAKSSWYKMFGFPIDGIIEFEVLKVQLRQAVAKDFRIDRAISDIVKNKGKSFSLFEK